MMFGGTVTQPQQSNINWTGAQTYPPKILPPSIPVRVVFSPEQISPQEIPTNGMPAIFPLNDGSKIIVKSLLPNGMFDEQVYIPEPKSQPQPVAQGIVQNNQPNPMEQLLSRMDSFEATLNKVLGDLYGQKKDENGGTAQ